MKERILGKLNGVICATAIFLSFFCGMKNGGGIEGNISCQW